VAIRGNQRSSETIGGVSGSRRQATHSEVIREGRNQATPHSKVIGEGRNQESRAPARGTQRRWSAVGWPRPL